MQPLQRVRAEPGRQTNFSALEVEKKQKLFTRYKKTRTQTHAHLRAHKSLFSEKKRSRRKKQLK